MSKGSIEQAYGLHLRAPLRTRIGNTNPWSGRTTLSSGSATSTVSTTRVNSDSIVLLSEQVSSAGASAVQSGAGGWTVVNSIVSGVSFALARSSGQAIAWDSTIMWNILKTGDA